MDRLGQAANILQVTGLDAFMLVSMIMQAALTARHNKDLCQKLAEQVQIVDGLLRNLNIPELTRHPETKMPLDQLAATLLRAYKLVRSCSQGSKLYQIVMGADFASKLRQAQEEIDRYTILIPTITTVAIIIAQRITQEVQEDLTSDPAPTQRPPLSLQVVTEFLALEEPPPQGPTLAHRSVLLPEIYFPTQPRKFSHKELSQATQGFSDKEKVGFGCFYRGFLRDRDLYVAIKRLPKPSGQDCRTIINSLRQLRHPNIVHFFGWCEEAGELFLVYEYLTKGCLETNLNSSTNILTWAMRYNIIQDLGSTLVYLHHELNRAVAHGGIKPSNVMLDSSFNAKLGDFVHGDIPPGYKAYEDPTSNDVYKFGMVVLEVACGPGPTLSLEAEKSEVRLVQWVWGLYVRGALLDAADPHLKGKFDESEMMRALKVGLWCVHRDHSCPPSIQKAIQILRAEERLPDLPPVTEWHSCSSAPLART